jgi:predicted nucleotidyltransferase
MGCDNLRNNMEKYNNKCILINILKEVLEKDEDVLFAYLYGSHVDGFAHLESDVDIALYLKHSDIKGFIEKEKKLTSILVAELHPIKSTSES